MNDLSISFKNLVRISLPLMLACASQSLMLFMDRVFLGHFSLESMNTSVAIGVNTAMIIFMIVSVASIAEVLAGQYNGAQEKKKVARPVWQMIFFSFLCSLFTVPLALWGKSFFLADNLLPKSGQYYEILMLFAPFWGVNAALAGFFAATGRPGVVTITALVANLINIGLDYVLIFGMGPVPSLGIDGAAIATVFAQLIQCVGLFVLFLSKKNKEEFSTARSFWFFPDFKKSLQIGIPNALSHGVEIAAWAFLVGILSKLSDKHLTLFSVSQSVMILFGFINDGLKQGVVALAANTLGSKKFSQIYKLLKSGLLFQTLVVGLLFFPLVIFPELSLSLLGDFSAFPDLMAQMKLGLALLLVFIFFDGLVWVLAGVMTAGGDTKVIMMINALTVWLFAIVPSWYFLVHKSSPAWYVYLFPPIYAAINFMAHYFRFKQAKWQVHLK